MNPVRELLNGSEGGWLNGVIETRGEAHSSQHAQLIFGKAAFRVADGTDNPRIEVLAAAYEIKDLILDRIEEKTVDSEVPALDVLARILTVADLVRMAAIAIPNVAAESCHFDHTGMLGGDAACHVSTEHPGVVEVATFRSD